MVERVVCPWYYYDIIYNLSPFGKIQRNLLEILHGFTKEVIRNREITFKSSDVENLENEETEEDFYTMSKKKKRLAMLDLLISAKNKGEFIDAQGIEEEVDTFMFEVRTHRTKMSI